MAIPGNFAAEFHRAIIKMMDSGIACFKILFEIHFYVILRNWMENRHYLLIIWSHNIWSRNCI